MTHARLLADSQPTPTPTPIPIPSTRTAWRTLGALAVFAMMAGSATSQTASLTESFTFTVDDSAANDRLGTGVAIDGNVLLAGAQKADALGIDSGSAYVAVFNGTSWVQKAQLLPSDGANYDTFGLRVALEGDVAVVSAHLNDNSGFANAGAVYVFRYNGTSWNQEQKLVPFDAEQGGQFGFDVALSGDRIAVGARNRGSLNTGAVYTYRFDGSAWQLEAQITPAGLQQGDSFGYSLALDGDLLAVGALNDDTVITNAGACYVFRWNSASWQQEAKLFASNAGQADNFGYDLAAHDDVLVVGAGLADVNFTNDGAVYVFEFDGSSWAEEAMLLSGSPANGNQFGRCVATCTGVIAVGEANSDDQGTNSGKAWLFKSDEMDVWQLDAELTQSGTAGGNLLGRSIAIHGSVVVGAVGAATPVSGAGAVYGYVLSDPPIADAGFDIKVPNGSLVTLNGTASYDDNVLASELIYSWTFGAVPDGSSATLVGADTATPSFTADVIGIYTVELVVADDCGRAGSDTVKISSFNLAPTADAGLDQVGVLVGDLAVFSAIASTDPDGDELTYEWELISGPTGSVAALTHNADYSIAKIVPDAVGNYEIRLTVTDPHGAKDLDIVVLSAVTAQSVAVQTVHSTLQSVTTLPSAQVTTGGNKTSLRQKLIQARLNIVQGKYKKAAQKIKDAIKRTDGCALRGTPDPMGVTIKVFGFTITLGQHTADWVTSCAAQAEIYAELNEALDLVDQLMQ